MSAIAKGSAISRNILLVALLLPLRVMLGAPSPGKACCTADNADRPVRIASQEVLIIWDAATGTEHFIRRADFRMGKPTESFGFLVPTPSRPNLAEAPDAVFGNLAALSRPKTVTRFDIQWSLLLPLLSTPHRASGVAQSAAVPGEAVREVSRTHVAGYDAVVLQATDPKALATWLGKHGFTSRPEIADWATPYIEARWMVTAFTYKPRPDEEPSGTVSTPAVRMTFTAPQPIFPYRVPSDNRQGGNLLRLYYVGAERASAQLGPTEWSATTTFASQLGTRIDHALAGAIPHAGELGEDRWLTVFEDATWPSGKDDLYFHPAATQRPVTPPPIVRHRTVFFPLDVLLLLGIPAVVIIARKRTVR